MTKVYKNFTREELNKEYDVAASVEGVQSYFVQYLSRSKATREKVGASFDVPYGTSSAETLDIFFPNSRSNCPIHIFFHGGGYRSQDKWNFSYVAEPLVEAGAIVVIPNYGLCPSVRLDDIIQQTRSSIAWVYANARIMGGNPNAITISGHSSGAHTVARMLETDWSFFHRTPHDVIKAAIAISGMYDQEPRRLSYVNEFIRLSEEESLRNSCFYNTPSRRIPYLLAVGSQETAEYVRQTVDFAAALRSRSYDVEHMIVEDRNHYDILDSLLDFEDPLGKKLHSFVWPK
ncbi:hypothetical protein LMG24238_06716 [Paraburkholderia sediminicola]|uniref:BD-FAE-like domain-containing protein n=1 Tax=Paraburkholderia sediminicola TaxID=458836 RepID=A0A6J5CPF1_9BURK|nr:alpha/beta hydrolase [Paraburkholderia sediminicola]CAB3741104.1 hypothetical protein LMG24238_06716 [Paraburkholderia sediminicola]